MLSERAVPNWNLSVMMKKEEGNESKVVRVQSTLTPFDDISKYLGQDPTAGIDKWHVTCATDV